jgi:hypothetical protein
MTHRLSFEEAEKLGWQIEPRFDARKGDQRFVGTAAELTTLIAEHEERATLHAEQLDRAHGQHHASNISGLIRRMLGFEREHQRAWDMYRDKSRDHRTRMKELESATAMRKRETEAFEELYSYPTELLLENEDFLRLQAALRPAGF